jgi:integrase
MGLATRAEVSHLCPGPRRKPISNPLKWIVRTKAALGVDFEFHDLRRTAASIMTGSGSGWCQQDS